MAEKLKIISLGGLSEIGKNLTVYEYGNDILLVDCGMGFPDDEMYGVDVVIPDFTYLVKNREKIEVQYFQSAVKTYMKSKDKDLTTLVRYADMLSVRDEIMKYVEVLV